MVGHFNERIHDLKAQTRLAFAGEQYETFQLYLDT